MRLHRIYDYNFRHDGESSGNLAGIGGYDMAQQSLHQSDPAKQHAARQRPRFLTGSWSGEAHVQRGAGDFSNSGLELRSVMRGPIEAPTRPFGEPPEVS